MVRNIMFEKEDEANICKNEIESEDEINVFFEFRNNYRRE